MTVAQLRVSARRRAVRYALLAGTAPVVLASVPAHAQNANVTTNKSGQLEEITVTVARRAQNLQKVSAAIQVVSGAKIAAQGLTNIAQITADLPSVQATTQPAGFSVDIRGQGGDLPSGQSQGSVALELDGVYNINSIGTILGFYDLDRLEVLPGPQSTQYGPDADGGVVDVITKDPVIGNRSGYASLTVGNYSLVRLEAAQNIPINDELAMRVAFSGIYRGSYFSPKTSNDVGQGGRVKVLYHPTEALSVKLEYEIDHIGGTGPGFEVGGPPTLGNVVNAYQGGSINDYGNPWDHPTASSTGQSFGNSQSHLYQNEAIATINYKINPYIAADEIASFTDIVGSGNKCSTSPPNYGTTDPPQVCSAAASAFGIPGVIGGFPGGVYAGVVYPYAPYHSYTSETRLHNAPGNKLIWNLGFYHWSYTFAGHAQTLDRATNQIVDETEEAEGFTRTTTNAVFGQATYPVLPDLRIIAGLRESFDSRVRNQSGNGNTLPDGYLSIRHFDYTAGLEYDVTPSSMLYGKVSTGYRPASLNYSGALSEYLVQPNEVNTAFEVGSKNRFFDNRLQLNVDGFYYIQTGYQFGNGYGGFTAPDGTVCNNGSTDPQCSVPPLSLRAHDKGIESQARFNLTPNDQIGNTLTAMDATFDQHQTTCRTYGLTAAELASGVCYALYNDSTGALQSFPISGAYQAHSPTFATNFTYNHTFDFNTGNLRVGGEVFYSSSFYTHPVENAFSRQPKYAQVGLNTDYTPDSGKWVLSGYVHNLTNYAVKESTYPETTIADPRTFGFNLNYKW